MANPVCTRASLVEAVPCLRDKLTPRQRKLAQIYFMANELAAIGGTNYLSGMSTGKSTPAILSDSVAFRTLNIAEVETADIQIDYLNASNNGGSPAANTSDILADVACLQAYDNLDSIYILLKCALGRHAAYPQ